MSGYHIFFPGGGIDMNIIRFLVGRGGPGWAGVFTVQDEQGSAEVDGVLID